MKPTKTRVIGVSLLLAMIALAALTGCATNTYPQQQQQAGQYYEQPVQRQPQPVYQQSRESYGSIDSIQVIRAPAGTSGAGAVVGGIAGAALGNQVGGGSGRALATVAGAVGGGYAGNAIEKHARSTTMTQVRVRMSNGSVRSFTEAGASRRHNGQHVKVVNGHLSARG